MVRNLIQTGNSKALIISKDMRDHLGVDDEVDIEFRKNSIVIRNPNDPEATQIRPAPKAAVAKPKAAATKAKAAPVKAKGKAAPAKEEKASKKSEGKGKKGKKGKK